MPHVSCSSFFKKNVIHPRMHLRHLTVNFQTLYVTEALQLEHNIVIAYELEART